MHPLTALDLTYLIAGFLLFSTLLWMLPSCGDDNCTEAHRKHSLATRVDVIERNHLIFHDASRPQPLCSLCQARKRDDEP